MASFTITIPDDKIVGVLAAFAAVNPPDGGDTNAVNAKKVVRRFIRNTYHAGERILNAPASDDITVE